MSNEKNEQVHPPSAEHETRSTPHSEAPVSFEELRKIVEDFAARTVEFEASAPARKNELESSEYPPELMRHFNEIRKAAVKKMEDVNTALGRAKEQLIAVLNSITGGTFENLRSNPGETKMFSGIIGGVSIKERMRLEKSVNIDHIREHAEDVGVYLSEKIAASDIVLLGELHTNEGTETKAIANLLEQAKAAGVTDVGLEIPEYYQDAVDHFMETGRFVDTDNPADYDRVGEYEQLFREQFLSPSEQTPSQAQEPPPEQKYQISKLDGISDAMFTFERQTRKNFLFRHGLNKQYLLLKKIREANLRPLCLDANATYRTSEKMIQASEAYDRNEIDKTELTRIEKEVEAQRDVCMSEKLIAASQRGGKIIALLGNRHVARGGMPGRDNVADLLRQTDRRTASIILDRDCEQDPEVFKESPSATRNSVLYSRVSGEPDLSKRSFGLDLVPQVAGQNTARPYDGYVRLSGS